ncbi:MAG: DNA methylase [Oscillospiraceae bacterium]|nr:DNA methylase [Oscillospiraceae bacterium]
MKQKIYAAIDLKSFYASVECIQRGLDPLKTNLLVADASRTEKTICLAVSPSLKSYGIPGRARLFEAVQKVNDANALRKLKAPGQQFRGKSWDADALNRDPGLAIDYIVAPPQMAMYMETSTKIYEIYLKYVAPEDMHVYSIDEVFLDITPYLRSSGLTPYAFVRRIIQDVLQTTGITAAAGIGTNLYLCKVAMDIVAKHVQADADGVRIAQLDEMRYRKLLWDHKPLTDFWRVGRGYEKRLEKVGIRTMGEIARCSLGGPNEFYNEDLLYKLFGVNAELLIDHAWGIEPCTIGDIKAYRPETNSLGSGQVLSCAYTAEKAKLVMREMTDLLVLELVDKHLVTNQMVLTVGYDIDNLTDPERRKRYSGAVVTDHYGRKIPKHAQGTVNLSGYSSSTREITEAVMELFDRIVDRDLLVRRMNIAACHVLQETKAPKPGSMEQLDLFVPQEDTEKIEEQRQREKRRQQAVIGIKKKYGKNAILKGMNLEEGATARDRNRQIGGHKA